MATSNPLTIGDGSGWHFVNGAWTDGGEGALTIPPDLADAEIAPLQGAHFAFDRTRALQDCRVSFDFLLRGHSDTGIILRARDESHFYLVHFPNCGQASRAQHFWAALSKMDDAGYLELVRLQMLPRVPSTNGIRMRCEITLQGDRFTVRVGDYGRFEVCDGTYGGPGAVGAYLFGKAEIGNVRVDGQAAAPIWRSGFEHPTNWWHPLPAGPGYWQQPIDIKRFDDGELLMLVNVQDDTSDALTAHAQPFLTRSADDGGTWSELQPLGLGELASSWSPARMHLSSGGRLIAMLPGTDHKLVYESGDRGRTWSEAGTTNLHVGPPQDPPVQSLAPMGFLNLADGGVLAGVANGNRQGDLLVLAHALKVHVQDPPPGGMALDVLDDHRLGLAAQMDREDAGLEGLALHLLEQLGVVERDGRGLAATAVEHRRHLAPPPQPPAVAGAQCVSGLDVQFEPGAHDFSPRRAPDDTKGGQSTYSELTDSASVIRRMVSASSSATLS